MRAVLCREPGGPDVLEVRDLPDPRPADGEVVIDVAASAVNRADLMQRQGNYPPPPGASDILGLECSGTVAEVGRGVSRWQLGDRVCALLVAGGYADKVAVPAGQLLPVPAGLDLVHAAALPEVVTTVWSNVFMVAGLQPDEVLLVHGGGSGIGTMAIQLAKALGAQVACTVGSEEKARACLDLGADLAINYRDEDFVSAIGRPRDSGADVILDNMGAKYLRAHVDLLAPDGRLVVIGFQGGRTAEIDLGVLLAKRASVAAISLRGRPLDQKADICRNVAAEVWPLLADGTVRPTPLTTYALDDVVDAHRALESGDNVGKIVLRVSRA